MFVPSFEIEVVQVDVINRIIEKYPEDLEFAGEADDIERAFARGRIASLIGVEGGHAIDSSLAVLRMLYMAGAR